MPPISLVEYLTSRAFALPQIEPITQHPKIVSIRDVRREYSGRVEAVLDFELDLDERT